MSSSQPSMPDASRSVLLADVEAMARLYRRLVLLIGLEILLGFLRLPANLSSSPAMFILALVYIPLVIVAIVMTTITAYKLTGYLRAGSPVLWAIATILPCVNIIVLLALSSKAQAWCQQYGIKVGLLGPTKESLEEFRRRVLTSDFE